jgi:hypothetical protein
VSNCVGQKHTPTGGMVGVCGMYIARYLLAWIMHQFSLAIQGDLNEVVQE